MTAVGENVPDPTEIARSWPSWVGQGGWAVADQLLFAGAGFLLHILLARWLPAEDYGAFALAYSVLFLLSTVHSAFLLEPMTVFGASKDAAAFRQYLGLGLFAHCVVTLILAALLVAGVVGPAWEVPEYVTRAFLGLSIALPLVLLQWLLRRAAYIRFQPQRAFASEVFYTALTLCGLWAMYRLNALSSLHALIVVAIASAGASAWLIVILRPRLVVRDAMAWQQAVNEAWRYGRWAVGVGILLWVSNNVYYFFLPWFAGLEEVAAFRALLNLLSPHLHLTVALAGILLPLMSREWARVGSSSVRMVVRRVSPVLLATAAVYSVVLGVAGPSIMDLIYQGKYNTFGSILWLGVPLPLLWSTLSLFSNALRAMNRPDLVFRGYVAASLVAVPAGSILVAVAGVAGALLAWSASVAAGVLVMAHAYRRAVVAA